MFSGVGPSGYAEKVRNHFGGFVIFYDMEIKGFFPLFRMLRISCTNEPASDLCKKLLHLAFFYASHFTTQLFQEHCTCNHVFTCAYVTLSGLKLVLSSFPRPSGSPLGCTVCTCVFAKTTLAFPSSGGAPAMEEPERT